MDARQSLGLEPDGTNHLPERSDVVRYINLKLAAMGLPPAGAGTSEFPAFAEGLLAHYRELGAAFNTYLCPADQRIQAFLDETFAAHDADTVKLPTRTLVLDRYGLARELSLPIEADEFKNDILSSYRTQQGVLHNPLSDRRTTKGVFHVADFGLPVADDKLAVPVRTYARLLAAAFQPPTNLARLPFTNAVETWVSLMLRPVVSPQVFGVRPRKTMETRFFAPGGLVSNLDFVESIFGNAGDPYLPANDAGLDVEHWSGHTGCVILAPHILGMNKKTLGLPHFDQADERARRDGMCWKSENENYNDGLPFKITLRSKAGVIVTLLADNYFGYCKKEVKTQISYAANLAGWSEEEHAGGALAFPNFNLGERFRLEKRIFDLGHNYADVLKMLAGRVNPQPDGYAIDKFDSSIVYVHETTTIDVPSQRVTWQFEGKDRSIKLVAGKIYIHPTGYKLRLERHPGAPSWRLVGTAAEGTFCHKPSTVSGGGKSEISKPLTDAIQYGSLYVNDPKADLDAVGRIIERSYADRHIDSHKHDYSKRPSRKLLDAGRSLGSVIKLLTPSDEFTASYNAELEAIPNHVRAIVFIIKRFYKPEWGGNWRDHFTVDDINGSTGHELKLNGRKLVGSYLRIGFSTDGNWRLYKLRQDFIAADKVQMEDDITASIVVPSTMVGDLPAMPEKTAVKLTENCESRLFQRPDDAVHPGLDRQTELDMSKPGLFASNYAPLTKAAAREMVEEVAVFERFSDPMKQTLIRAAERPQEFVVCPAKPRLVDGSPTKNPRYLQTRPDISRPREAVVAEIGVRLWRRVKASEPVLYPVSAVLAGRRNNPRDEAAGIRPLAVYGPIHYQELPELFMDFISSLTGKSPSTTGAGSEGALTKGPFNALRPCADLNNALVSYILTGLGGFTTAAGYVGPGMRVDHDVSLLIPEIWCRLRPSEREPETMIREQYLEPIGDRVIRGRRIASGRLGYRITAKFVHAYFGRVFDSPTSVFSEALLRPESQDEDSFADGVDNIVEAHQRVAESYLSDGSVEDLCLPLRALVHVMARGVWNGLDATSPELRKLFTLDYLLGSNWYRARLDRLQQNEIEHWQRRETYLKATSGAAAGKLEYVRTELAKSRSAEFRASLVGTLGADLLGNYPD